MCQCHTKFMTTPPSLTFGPGVYFCYFVWTPRRLKGAGIYWRLASDGEYMVCFFFLPITLCSNTCPIDSPTMLQETAYGRYLFYAHLVNAHKGILSTKLGGTPVPHGPLISTVEQASSLLGLVFVGETGHKYKGLQLGWSGFLRLLAGRCCKYQTPPTGMSDSHYVRCNIRQGGFTHYAGLRTRANSRTSDSDEAVA